MAPVLTECLAYNLVSWEGILRQPKLDHLVLCVCKAVAGVKQFLKVLGKDWLKYLQIRKQFSRVTKSGRFKTFKFLKRLDVCAFLILGEFFSETKRFLMKLAFPAQTSN